MKFLPSFLTARARARRGTPIDADLWPDTAIFELRRYRCGDSWNAVLLVTGYPAVLSWGWLGRLAGAGSRIDLALHLDGVPAAVASMQLQRRRARLESQRRYQAARGRLEDPEVEAAAEDAADLAAQVSRGRSQLHRQAVYLTVHAETPEALDLACARVRSRAAAVMIDVRPATARQMPGALAAAPFGIDPVGAARTVDTASASAAFPFASPDVSGPIGDAAVLYGLNLYSGAPVLWDRWDTSVVDNHNSITIARSGAGKSYLTKTEILRQLYQGVRVIVVDPESEYLALAAHVGGAVHRPGTAEARLNPLAMPAEGEADEVARRRLFAVTVVETLLGERLSGSDAALLQRAVAACFEAAGITDDPATWTKPAPVMADVVAVLATDPAGADLAARLGPWVGPGTVFDVTSESSKRSLSPLCTLNIWDLAAVPPELVPVVTLVVLDRIWRSLRSGGPRTLVVVDEAWLTLSSGQGATWLSRLAKSSRKRSTGLAVVTQDAEDVTSTELGRTVVHNSATQIIMRQAAQAIDSVQEAFRLTAAEAAHIASARRGEGLLLGGGHHLAFRSIASAEEHRLCLTGLDATAGRRA